MMRGPDTATRRGWKLVLVCAVLLLGACRDSGTASGTALYVTTEFDPTLLLTQVRVWGTVQQGEPFGPHVLPEQPARLLSSGETLRVVLGDDAANGAQAKVYVEGLRDGSVVARGESTVQLRDGHEVDVTLRLEPSTSDTFCLGCTGCCDNGVCTSASPETCGAGGNSCVACDPRQADTCDARGVCVCGANPACSDLTVDRCVGGQCKCGSSGPCAQGQECVQGTCRCTPNSCAGCCANNVCEPGNLKDKCGKGGEACRKCNKNCNPDRTCS
ncbi:MAG TPA: hypothetical protein VFZ09_31715 [Archangium sp.]|uniref:hypothetical protein n=1 Tax=Archangium sp. TaxID=1872627 RepID=UPI002E3309D4|nr:hypothetical protein [Archangium sp.]HEX5750835.1 hypothetical protein [Archangium sp.]